MPIGMWVKRGLLLILTVMVAIALKSCNLAQFTKAEAADTSRIVFSAQEPKTFNPTLSQEYPNIFIYTFQGLVTRDGKTGELIPLLADSWDISEDGRQYTFTLREGLQWSDGEPLTADDVMFTYQDVIFNEAIPAPPRDTFRVGEEGILPTIEKLSDRQVVFKLPEPFAPFLVSLGTYILPAHVLQESVDTLDEAGDPMYLSMWGTGTAPEEIVTNGPYRLGEYLPGQRVIFERNPYYWETDELGEQQPHIQQLVWQVIEDDDNELLQFRSGGLDVIRVVPDIFSLMKREEERGDFTIYEGGPALGTTFMAFNLNKASRNGKPLVDPVKSRWFNSLAFRKAVSHAIDRPTMVNNIYQGLGAPQTSPVPVQSPFYARPEDGIPTYEYDLDKARELLEQDGFQYNSAGELLDADGNRVRFTLVTNAGNKIRESIGAQIKQDLGKIGILVDFQPISFNALVTKLGDSLEWDAHIIGFTASLDPHSGSVVWLLDGSLHAFNQQALAGQEPLEGWEAADWEKEIANIYIQAAQEVDFEKRRALYIESQRLAEEYLPFLHLVNPLNLGAIRNSIENTNYSGIVRPFALWNVEELTMRAE